MGSHGFFDDFFHCNLEIKTAISQKPLKIQLSTLYEICMVFQDESIGTNFILF